MKVSIIITNYNYSKYIKRCIRSCISQSMDKRDYEIIVIDDNSSDNSLNQIQEFKKNIKIIVNKKNLGVAKSVNKAIKFSKGKYFVRIDADDYMSNYLITFLYGTFLVYPNKFGVACDYYHVTDEGDKIERQINSREEPIACGIMYNKKKFIKSGMYNSEFKHREEEEIRNRLGKKYDIFNLNLPLYKYRMHKSNKTKSKSYLIDFRKKIENLKTKKNKQLLKYSKLMKNVVAIIPAKGNSERFKNKNIHKFFGKPMIGWAISELKKSSLINDIYVTSENKKVLDVSKRLGAKIILRPKELSEKNVHKLDAIRHAVKEIELKTKNKISLILSVQANSPEIKMNNIEDAIKKLINDKLQEVISTDRKNNCNAALRIMNRKALFQKSLSTDHGFIMLNLKDIHYKDDLSEINKI